MPTTCPLRECGKALRSPGGGVLFAVEHLSLHFIKEIKQEMTALQELLNLEQYRCPFDGCDIRTGSVYQHYSNVSEDWQCTQLIQIFDV